MRFTHQALSFALCAALLGASGCAPLEQAAGQLEEWFGAKPSTSSAASAASEAAPADSSAAEPSSSSKQSRIRSTDSIHHSDLKKVDPVGELADTPAPSRTPDSVRLPTFNLPPLHYPYRAMLSADQQTVYDQVLDAARELNPNCTPARSLTPAQTEDVVHAVYYDHPNLFWLDPGYRYSYTNQNVVTGIILAFNDTARNFEASSAKYNAALDKLVNAARKYSTPVEQALFVHDYIAQTTEYLLDAPYNQSSYSALVGRKSVCAGYARAFQHAMIELGIPCYYCVGFAGEDHAWNIIQLGDDFYNIDVAWDDPVGNTTNAMHYEYFNLTDQEISVDHERAELSLNLPACVGTAYGYNEVFGTANAAPVQKGGSLLAYDQLGYHTKDVLESLAAFEDQCFSNLVAAGTGTHTFEYLLRDDALREEIYASSNGRSWFEAYVAPAAKELELERCVATLELQARLLADDYILLTQTISFTDD